MLSLCYTHQMKIEPSSKIYITESKIPGGGRGVFAKVAIKKGELIERCPVIILKEEEELIEKSLLAEYIYFLGKKKKRLTLALGLGSIYNHTYTPNAKYKEITKDMAIEFRAIKNIKKNDEITVNYNQDSPKKTLPLWFEIAKITKSL